VFITQCYKCHIVLRYYDIDHYSEHAILLLDAYVAGMEPYLAICVHKEGFDSLLWHPLLLFVSFLSLLAWCCLVLGPSTDFTFMLRPLVLTEGAASAVFTTAAPYICICTYIYHVTVDNYVHVNTQICKFVIIIRIVLFIYLFHLIFV